VVAIPADRGLSPPVPHICLYVAEKLFSVVSRRHRVVKSADEYDQRIIVSSFYRTSYASTVLAVVVCLSVRLSVCLSQVGVVQR